ncbi:hypothetical protein H310_07702 [Aphanomyces invadans]|uniref:SPRY domain-containing protein n=1 Tax=Aphanomyces invadans TaxID=157072 RepID=A0A024U296_9STRA|nr:hypothetical protein H310_07702 [Aphanomyces invadans]ETW00335.1 hypothetical protein H310_07702 [Aphanomyces invadans]|eukprot:XP_008871360.1 hypothetical protein H310_07702 [Aphanomyces invadans]
MQYSTVLSRHDARGRGGGFSTLATSIMAIPIKAKKQTKSQRKAAAAAARATTNRVQTIQWVEEMLGEHVWELCFEYLDVRSLCQSKLVCRHFQRLAMLPLPWMHQYASVWLPPRVSLPDAYYRHSSWIQLWRMHESRMAIDVKLSTRADVTIDTDTRIITVLNNSMLRNLEHGAVESIRSLQPLPPIPCATALHRYVMYFEVTASLTATAISLGMVHLPDHTMCPYGFGSDAHVGWHPVSFGYHSHPHHTPSPGSFPLIFHNGMDVLTMPLMDATATADIPRSSTDVFGCGYDQDHHRIFFTHNGTLLGVVPYDIPPGNYCAAFSVDTLYASVTVNWGQLPFAYAIEAHIANHPAMAALHA